uniref:Bbp48 n=1 Tax=uncultured organism MedDCM-OCT-S04-C777 TaxID=743619 RepID=D6PK82_9ZZZZ|nr:Bbp48 [uncultured organism MedDCM-OCT-S04-C777]
MLKKGFNMADNIKEPAHYIANKIEPIDFIIENNFNFCEGNVIKYISRYKRKNGIEDLKKARQYIDFFDQKRS